MARHQDQAGWGLVYLGIALFAVGLLLADPRIAAAQPGAGTQTVTDCYATATSQCNSMQPPPTSIPGCIATGACNCICLAKYPVGSDRTTCLTMCSDASKRCAGESYCNPSATQNGSTSNPCTTAGNSIVTPCGGACDGGTICGGCGCLKTTAAGDPLIDNKCRCQYQLDNF